MNDAVAYYILYRVTDYLLKQRPFNMSAYLITSNLKGRVIAASSSSEYAKIQHLIDCMSWKDEVEA